MITPAILDEITERLAHRLARMFIHGEAPASLRVASRAENMANTNKHRDSASPYKGVSFVSRGKLAKSWRAQFRATYLGNFATPEEAHAAYCGAASAMFGARANGGLA